MLVSINIESKKLGTKELFRDLRINLLADEKVALIGRNGVGKTTLFHMLTGADTNYHGEINFKRGTQVVATAQEHRVQLGQTAVNYILSELPDYLKLKHIIDTYPETMGDNLLKISDYTDALARFGELGYYEVESNVVQTLAAYQIPEALAYGDFARLSGGQKRFVELAKVTQAKADLALIDEPTNHMDYAAKERFITWLDGAREGVCVISHDRDVLKHVDRIIEIRDGSAMSFKGNYDAYLKQNSTTTVTQVDQYEVTQRTLENLKKQMAYARSKKAGWTGTADKKNPFVVMETRLKKQYDALLAASPKPSFWIDQESVDQLSTKVVERYDKYKAKNIRIQTRDVAAQNAALLKLDNVSIGYDKPLFASVGFSLPAGGRLQLRGRNGAGKTSLVKVILATLAGSPAEAKVFAGDVEFDKRLRVGVYEQEIDEHYLDLPLGQAVAQVFAAHGLSANEQRIKQLLSMYLFDPGADYNLPVHHLSGGQKARFQLIAMLCHDPNLLILDEPTNHLDLPSIEELEKALTNYQGAIIYISHDSYFTDKLGGEVVQIGDK